MTNYDATPAQLKLIDKLTRESGLNSGVPVGLTKQEASKRIDFLIELVKRVNTVAAVGAKSTQDRPEKPSEDLTPGIYELPNGEIYQVKLNGQKTRMYAKKIVEIRGERLTEGDDVVQIEFEYAPGAIYNIRPEHRMSLEKGKALTIRYGKCLCCSRKLKAAKSVERGIGPVCIKYFAA